MRRTFIEEPQRELTEPGAIRRAQDGDAEAFEYLYKAHCKHVYSICLRVLKNPADAEDLTQQAFLQIFRKIGTFRFESGFSTWLHRVTLNLVLMHLRRKEPAAVLVADSGRAGKDGGAPRELGADDPLLLGAIDRLNLKRAMRMLPLGYRRPLMLHDIIGYQHAEMAEILGCSIASSKSRLHRARRRLRRLLQGEPWQIRPVVGCHASVETLTNKKVC